MKKLFIGLLVSFGGGAFLFCQYLRKATVRKRVYLTDEQKTFYDKWITLSEGEKALIARVINNMK